MQFCRVDQGGDATQVHDSWGGDIIYHINRYSGVCQVLLRLKSTTSAEAGIKERDKKCVVLEKSVVIITCAIGITKVEAAGKH